MPQKTDDSIRELCFNKLAVFNLLRYQILFAIELHGDKNMIAAAHAINLFFEHIINTTVLMKILHELKLLVDKKVEFFTALAAADV